MVTHKDALELATAKAWKEEIAGTRKASEVIISAYLDARGLVMVPKEPDVGMIGAWYRYKNGHRFADEEPARDTSDVGAYRSMLAAAPDPFAEDAQ